jgi:hypothetical protein
MPEQDAIVDTVRGAPHRRSGSPSGIFLERFRCFPDGHYCVERWAGPFARTFRFPAGVDTTQLTVTLEHGVLEVRLPKRVHATDQATDVHKEEGAPVPESEDVLDAAIWGPRFREPVYAA